MNLTHLSLSRKDSSGTEKHSATSSGLRLSWDSPISPRKHTTGVTATPTKWWTWRWMKLDTLGICSRWMSCQRRRSLHTRTSPQLHRKTPSTVAAFCPIPISSSISLRQVCTIDLSPPSDTIPPGKHTCTRYATMQNKMWLQWGSTHSSNAKMCFINYLIRMGT
jgi:hypothetical protein